MSAATQDGARAGTAPGGTPRPDRPRAEFLALGARRGHGAGLGLTFSRKQTSPSTTSAQTSKRASPRTADSNSRASPTCCGERHPSERAARATVGKGRRPGKAPRRFLLLGGPSSRPNHHSQWERTRRGEGSERLEQRRRRRAARRVPRVGRCGRPTAVPVPGSQRPAPPPGACPKQPPSGLLSSPAPTATQRRGWRSSRRGTAFLSSNDITFSDFYAFTAPKSRFEWHEP